MEYKGLDDAAEKELLRWKEALMSTIKEEIKAIIENLSEQKIQVILPLLRYLLEIEEHRRIPEEDGWKAFMVGFYSRIMKMKESWVLKIVHITEDNEEKAWEIFNRFNVDKEWSFTDCISKAIMEESEIKEVFAFDHHFEQMSFLRRP